MNRRELLSLMLGAIHASAFLHLTSCKKQTSAGLPYSTQYLDHYFQINLFGSPARWTFDLMLNPSGEDHIDGNQMITTKFINTGGASKPIYQTTEFKETTVPYFWSLQAKGEGGKSFKVNQLLDNTLILRGCNMESDGHEVNNRKLIAPVLGKDSLSSFLARKSSRTIPFLHLVGVGQPLNIAPSAFSSTSGSYSESILIEKKNSLSLLKSLFEKSSNEPLSSPVGMSELNPWQAEYIEDAYEKAKGVLNTSYVAVTSYYQKALLKYNKIIKENFNMDVAGLNDVIDPSSEIHKVIKESKGKYLDPKNRFHLWHLDNFILLEGVSKCFKSAKWEGLAEQFALNQTLLHFKIISSSMIIPEKIHNIIFTKAFNMDEWEKGKNLENFKKHSQEADFHFDFDGHNCGTAMTLIGSTYAYLALTGCIDSFINFLKTEKIFDKSLIHLVSEFEREPSNTFIGSEHGFNGHTSSFISGAIKEFTVLGNIYKKAPSTMFPDSGTWGAGAPLKSLDNRTMAYGNIAASISKVMGIPNVAINNQPLFELKDGVITPLIDECELI